MLVNKQMKSPFIPLKDMYMPEEEIDKQFDPDYAEQFSFFMKKET